VGGAQRSGHGRRLDELRPVADDRQNAQRSEPGADVRADLL
jgi:hypothetical protein